MSGADDRRKLTLERARRLQQLAIEWVRALEGDAEAGPLLDPERDEQIEKIDALLVRHSRTVQRQQTIIRAVMAARRYEKSKIRPPSPQHVDVDRALWLEQLSSLREVRGVNGVRARVDSYTPGALAKVDDRVIADAIAGKPKAEASILALLKAAGVPLAGKNPERMLRKYGYGN